MVLSREILEEALQQAKIGRMHILDSYDCQRFNEPREQLSALCTENLYNDILTQIKSVMLLDQAVNKSIKSLKKLVLKLISSKMVLYLFLQLMKK